MKKNAFSIIYCLILVLATVYVVLDIFKPDMIHSEEPEDIVYVSRIPSPIPTDTPRPTATLTPVPTTKPGEPTYTPTPSPTNTPTATPTSTPTPLPSGSEVIFSYEDDSADIQVVKYRHVTGSYGTTVYVADIRLDDPDRLKISPHTGSRKAPAELWSKYNAIISINGDMATDGPGYIIRNGVVYRQTEAEIKSGYVRQDLVLFPDGRHKFINENEVSCDQLINEGAWNVLSFGPVLMDEGQVVYDKSSCNSDKVNLSSRNPRTAIGQTAEGHFVFIVVDGRNGSVDAGLTYEGLIEVGQQAGCVWLYNLDGGLSSQMVFDGKVQNTPYSHGYKERNLTEIVYIGYKEE